MKNVFLPKHFPIKRFMSYFSLMYYLTSNQWTYCSSPTLWLKLQKSCMKATLKEQECTKETSCVYFMKTMIDCFAIIVWMSLKTYRTKRKLKTDRRQK